MTCTGLRRFWRRVCPASCRSKSSALGRVAVCSAQGGGSMLDGRVGRYVSGAVRTRAREFDQDLDFRLLQLDTEALRAGHLGGNGQLRGYSLELLRELRNRARYIFLEMQRALVLYPQALDAEATRYLIDLYSSEARAACGQLQKWVGQKVGTATAQHWRTYTSE